MYYIYIAIPSVELYYNNTCFMARFLYIYYTVTKTKVKNKYRKIHDTRISSNDNRCIFGNRFILSKNKNK